MTDPKEPPIPDLSHYSEETVADVQKMFDTFKIFRKMGIDHVSRAMLMKALGVPKDEIKPEDHDVKYELSEMYLDNEAAIDAKFEAQKGGTSD
ncbi:hypothetical protein E4H12_15015 [Candidatus Thorarchaeota archaeon]|nr:MAG: hypothetical protein E4H12_15015 [Candidatus Thorarchaeota archaeon]